MLGAIQAFVGANGGGKSLAAVETCVVPAVNEGRVIVSNMRLDVPDFKLLRSWRELIRLGVHIEHGVPCRLGPRGERLEVIDDGFDPRLELFSLTQNRPVCLVIDEITAALPSRSYASMPPQLQRILNQLRKVDVVLAWTAPNWSRCDVLLREVTQTVTLCRGYFPDRYARQAGRSIVPKRATWGSPEHPIPPAADPYDVTDRETGEVTTVRPLEPPAEGTAVRLKGAWRPRRLFRWTSYDAIDFEEFNLDQAKAMKTVDSRFYWRSLHLAQHLYRTSESVQLMDHLDDLGTCVLCSGKRTQHRCECQPLTKAEAFGQQEAGRAGGASRSARPLHPVPSP